MLNDEQNSELIDKFLKGNLNPSEMSLFEENLRNDASFKGELELQQSIVKTLQANRKAELKQRLNEIEVSATTSPLWKYAAVVGVFSAIGVLFFLNKFKTDLPSNVKNADKEVVSGNTTANTSLAEAKGSDLQNVVVSGEQTVTSSDNSAKIEAENLKPVVAEAKKNKIVSKEQSTSVPKFHSPEGVTMHEALSKELETPDHSLTSTPHLSASVAGVEVVKSKKHKFHYRYFDKKLFLYGNFDTKTYDILELNTSKGQSFYLKFEQNYYSLETDRTEISKLEQVKDSQILKELEEVQK